MKKETAKEPNSNLQDQSRTDHNMQKLGISTFQQIAAVGSASFLAVVAKISAATAALLALYSQDLTIVFTNALQDESTNYILLIPLIFAFLVYRKRKMLKASIPNQAPSKTETSKCLPTLSGFLLCFTAVILYWYGSYTFTPLEYHLLTIPLFAAGLTLALFNAQTFKELAVPLAFLIFLIPPPIEILYGLGSALSVFSAEASNAIVNWLGITSTISGEYGNPTISLIRPDKTPLNFTVDIACSGIYSIIGFFVFAAFIAYASRHKTWTKLAVLLLGLPLIAFLNIIRLSTILWIGYTYGEQLALQIFHFVGGWLLIFIGVAILFTITEKAVKRPKPRKPCEQCSSNSPDQCAEACPSCGRLLKYPKIQFHMADAAKIGIIAAAIIFLLLFQVPVFALTKGPAPIIIQTATGEQGSTEILPQIQGYTLQFLYRDKAFEQKAKQDASLIYSYAPTDSNATPTWLVLEIASTTSALHRWETCLITWPQTHGYQPKVSQLELRDIQIMENPPITARYFAFQYVKTDQTQLVLYWYETSIFTINDTSEQKKVKISLITFPKTPQEIQEAENQLQPIAAEIAAFWQPLKIWSQINLLISRNGSAFAAAGAALTIIVFTYQAFLDQQKKRSLQKLYSKLPTQEKLVVDAVYQTSQIHRSTTNNVAAQLHGLAGQTPTHELVARLQDAEDAGLIEQRITNANDEPIVLWKSRVLPQTM